MRWTSRATTLGVTTVLLLSLGLSSTLAASLPVVDDFESPLASGTDGTIPIGFFPATDPNSTLAYDTSTVAPSSVPDSAPDNTVLHVNADVVSWAVLVHAFEDSGATSWVTQDWSSYAGMQFWFLGSGSGTSMFVDVLDNRSPGSTTDDAERFTATFTDDTAGWRVVQLPFDQMTRKEVNNGAPNDGFDLDTVHGWAIGALATGGAKDFFVDDVSLYGVAPVKPLTVGFGTADTPVTEGASASVPIRLSRTSTEPVSVRVRTTTGTATSGVDYTPLDTVVSIPAGSRSATVSLMTLGDTKYQGERAVLLGLSDVEGAALGRPPTTRVNITDDDAPDPTLVADFESTPFLWSGDKGTTLTSLAAPVGSDLERPSQSVDERVLSATSRDAKLGFGRSFPQPQDWSNSDGVSFWYYGSGTRKDVTVSLRSATQSTAAGDPSTWKLAWSDEFDTKAGTPPDPEIWTHEIGDGTIIGKPGWGNDELEYYTDDPDNAATDGNGNLVITTRALPEDTDLLCYYGPCKYSSARLVTQNKAEFAYGRISSRISIPRGQGLWPAFWSLGSDINANPWPQSGEIDIMENVGRDPNTLFGTIHGPGYSGGQSFGGSYDFGAPMADEFHVVDVQWSPDHITWHVDGTEYHEAVPADVAPNAWVFNHPFFLLLNVAVGGNFGGPVGADTSFPQQMKVDYVRVYQSDQAEQTRSASFRDDTVGWRQVTLPFASFGPGTLDTSRISGISFSAQVHPRSPVLLDAVRLTCSDAASVTTAADSGPGSLRAALAGVCADATITVDPALAGSSVPLASPLSLNRAVTIDASAAPGFTLDGGGSVRPIEVAGGARVVLEGVSVRHGHGYELGGGILNNGDLTLDHVVVADNTVSTSGNDFWKGGGGVYTGEKATLVLRDSTVRDNAVTGGPGGGLYSFFSSTLTVERSTISGNSATDVGGAIRALGTTTVTASTISGNSATGWHGGGLFQTDGVATVESSTITGNTAPDGTAGGIFVGTFGDSSASVTVHNTIVGGNSGPQCFIAPWGAGSVALTSLGFNLRGDASCGEAATGDLEGDPQLGPLADNGGPTWTHLPSDGSPVVDHGSAAGQSVDQRGLPRPVGPAADIGAVELQ